MSWTWFFNDSAELLRVLMVGPAVYVGLVAMLRISGKRTLAKLNAFDLVVTVALGSTLATVLLSREVSLAGGLAALALLIGLQWVVAKTTSRWPMIGHLVKSEPKMIMHRGEMLRSALRAERITEVEVLAALRSQGFAGADDVEAVVLETDGTLSVVTRTGGTRALDPVVRPDDASG